MNMRQQRGLIIAAVCKLNRTPQAWLVPSQSGERIYTALLNSQSCTCPDHQEHGHKCKHIFAVEITIKREVGKDGAVTETKSITFTEEKTYKQDWPKYDLAQQIEKKRFLALLSDLTRNVPESPRNKTGRKPTLMRECAIWCSLRCSRFTAPSQHAGSLATLRTRTRKAICPN
jgi:uncharacterized Zn finger protein